MRMKQLVMAMTAMGTMGGAFVLATPASAAMDASDAMALCSRLSKKDARLECYDQVARDVSAGRLQGSGPAAPQQPAWAASPSAPAAQAPQQPSWATPPAAIARTPPSQATAPSSGFGGQDLPRTSGEHRESDGPDSINAQVASSTDNGLGMWRIKLADGAIWQMTERVSMFRPPAPNETVTIRKGALGSFLMDVGKQASVRVRRVQ